MNKREIFYSYIKEYLESPLEKYFPRLVNFKFLENIRKVYIIVGPRRAGKTYFCYQIIDNLIKQGIPKKQTLYVYLENDEFFPLSNDDLNLILETYFEIVGYDSDKEYFIFLDEIQEVENWHKFVLKVYSTFKNINLVLTGSSSKLLSSEIASTLRGKSISYQILPLTFDEVLIFKGLEKEKFYSKTKLLKLKNIFNEILLYGSFPEVVLQSENGDKLKLLEDYDDLIFYKDIIERYGFKNIKKLKWFKKLLISYMGNFVNLSKLAKQLSVEYNTVLSWLEGLSSTFFIFELKNFNLSLKKQIKSFSKIFILDNGFYTLYFRHYKQDLGKYFENFVFLEFRKRGYKENKQLFYFKDSKYDIDLLLLDDDIYLINVTYLLNEENFEREVIKLSEAAKYYNTKAKLIYYENMTDKNSYENVEFVKWYNIF